MRPSSPSGTPAHICRSYVGAVPGVTATQRYRLFGSGTDEQPVRYLCVYELGGTDPASAAAALGAARASGAFDMSTAIDVAVSPPGPAVRRAGRLTRRGRCLPAIRRTRLPRFWRPGAPASTASGCRCPPATRRAATWISCTGTRSTTSRSSSGSRRCAAHCDWCPPRRAEPPELSAKTVTTQSIM